MGKSISIDEIEEGMILDEPVINQFGQVLLNKGTSLSLRHKKVFLTWNIKTLKIKSTDEQSGIELSPEQIEISEKRLKSKVHWVPRNDIEKDLFNTAIILNARMIFNEEHRIKIDY